MTQAVERTWQDKFHGKFDVGDLVTALGPHEPGMDILGDGLPGLVVGTVIPDWGGETVPRIIKVMWSGSEIEKVYEDDLVNVEL